MSIKHGACAPPTSTARTAREFRSEVMAELSHRISSASTNPAERETLQGLLNFFASVEFPA